ncbi:hypothetical protein DICPUDRAFT_147394 [Dictyostelium purpureum]|uniref:Uncharacterized protein n=1 Tax=Dictyostelium purpureum TaxID=5786 RepID=F0Z8E2_DICPU|nr:uncharacterized protein DICPUDRAFT_147394 [Dictyostelium purpureum]EGC39796.1 hypothetical protein DICPUDRAFT_147394 [Dictyostelium purpureum]|eukprot:XP_003283663.1 hypothetical protein DICPUDRAFT_147394 [Dictyostelium purpureum]
MDITSKPDTATTSLHEQHQNVEKLLSVNKSPLDSPSKTLARTFNIRTINSEKKSRPSFLQLQNANVPSSSSSSLSSSTNYGVNPQETGMVPPSPHYTIRKHNADISFPSPAKQQQQQDDYDQIQYNPNSSYKDNSDVEEKLQKIIDNPEGYQTQPELEILIQQLVPELDRAELLSIINRIRCDENGNVANNELINFMENYPIINSMEDEFEGHPINNIEFYEYGKNSLSIHTKHKQQNTQPAADFGDFGDLGVQINGLFKQSEETQQDVFNQLKVLREYFFQLKKEPINKDNDTNINEPYHRCLRLEEENSKLYIEKKKLEEESYIFKKEISNLKEIERKRIDQFTHMEKESAIKENESLKKIEEFKKIISTLKMILNDVLSHHRRNLIEISPAYRCISFIYKFTNKMSTNNNQIDDGGNMDTIDCTIPPQNNQHSAQNPFSTPNTHQNTHPEYPKSTPKLNKSHNPFNTLNISKTQNYKNKNYHPNTSFISTPNFKKNILNNIIKNNEPILFFEPPTTQHPNIITIIQNFTGAPEVNQTKDKIIVTFTNDMSRDIFLKSLSNQNIIKINSGKEILELKFTVPEPFGLQPDNISLYIDFNAISSQILIKKFNPTTLKYITQINNFQTDKFDQSVTINHLTLKFNSCLERSLFLFHNNNHINTSSSELPYNHHHFTLRSTHLNLGPLKSNTIILDDCTINIESFIYTKNQHVLLNKFSICNKPLNPSKQLKLDLWLTHIGSTKLNDEIISLISLDHTTTLPTSLLTTDEKINSFENECSHLLKNLIIQIQPLLGFRAAIICNYTDIEDLLHVVKCSTCTNNKISETIIEYFNLLKKFNKKSKHELKDFIITMPQQEQPINNNKNHHKNNKRHRTYNNGRE